MIQTIIFFSMAYGLGKLCVPRLQHDNLLGIIHRILAGMFFFSLIAFVGMETTDLSFTHWSVVLGVIGCGLTAHHIFFKRRLSGAMFGSLTRDESHFLTPTLIIFGGLLILSLVYPVGDWDSLVLYDLRARVIEQTGSLRVLRPEQYYVAYPPMTSMVHAFTYTLGAPTPMPYYVVCFFLLYAYLSLVVARINGQSSGWIAALMMITMPQLFSQASIAYTNLPYALYFTVAVIEGFQYVRTGSRTAAVLSIVCWAASAWVRFAEPMWIVGLFLLLAGAFRHRHHSIIWLSPLSITTRVLWRFYMREIFGKETYFTQGGSRPYEDPVLVRLARWVQPEQWYLVLTYLLRMAIPVFGSMLLLLMLSLILERKMEYARKIEYLAVVLLSAMIVYGTYVIGISDLELFAIGNSVQRLLAMFIPMIAYLIGTSGVFQEMAEKLTGRLKNL